MKNIVLDTGTLIHITRESETGKRCLSALEDYSVEPNILISVVTKAELQSFIKQNNWGDKKLSVLNALLDDIIHIDISKNDEKLLNAYTHIDAYSQGKVADNSGNMLNNSARNMGKNDLWIAATAYALECPLLTADKDFDHLNGSFLTVIKV